MEDRMGRPFPDRESYRREALVALLEIFATANNLPIGLFEQRDGCVDKIASQISLGDLEEEYCKAIRTLPGGRQACEKNECLRVLQIMQSGTEKLTLCHAGLYSQAVPITVNAQTRAVVLYGEMRIGDEVYEERSMRAHAQAMLDLGVTGAEKDRLQRLLLGSRQFTREELNVFKATLPRVGAWLYRLFDEEDRLERRVEKVTHELQIRLQPVLAHAELLNYDLMALPGAEDSTKERAREVLNSTLALSTVIQNMGDFLEGYQFRRQSISPLVRESQRIYQSEAQQRAVDISVRLGPIDGKQPMVEVSADHLQYAFNNLLHNAVKYSFRGGPGRERFVRVDGRSVGRQYVVTFENYGVGILPEEIEEGLLFTDGYQGKLTEEEYRTGSGKGLFFTKQIIDRHRGRIKVSSRAMGSQAGGPEGQPHLNQFAVCLPISQSDGAPVEEH